MERQISSSLLQHILATALATPGIEVCGLLFGDETMIEEAMAVANVSSCPSNSFELDPAAHFSALRHSRQGGPIVVGHFHSHPNGFAAPSQRDAADASDVGQLWLIVANGEATLWRVDAPGCFSSVRLVVA